MEKPNLDQMWETFIKIPSENAKIRLSVLYNYVRSKIYPLICQLKDNGVLDWYCFLIHDRSSGVPTSAEDHNLYFHVRFALKKGADPSRFLGMLPNYCIMTRHIRDGLAQICGIDKSIVKDEEIENVWKIIGKQSEWFLEMLNIHKEEIEIPPQQVAQFLHFYANMAQLQVR